MLSFLDLRISSWSLRTVVVCRCVVVTRVLSFARSISLRRGTLPLADVIVAMLRHFSCHLGILL
jgi:hypothetical protein